MVDIDVRTLGEADWQTYRDLRLEALRESPAAFVATRDMELQYDEESWRERTRAAHQLVAESDGEPVGMVGLGNHGDDGEDGEILGLWVAPRKRRSRVAWRLLGAAVDQAVADGHKQLYFWVGSDNGAAVAFVSTFGFRPGSERRPAYGTEELGDTSEVAMVLPLSPDPGSVKNPWMR